MNKFESTLNFIKGTFNSSDFIPLHSPRFNGKEKEYLNECIDTTFVSSVGKFVDKFEDKLSLYTQSEKAIAVVNGTAGIQVALKLSGVMAGDEVITQALTFVATANAIIHVNAYPVFIDVDKDTMGLSPKHLQLFLEENAELRDNFCYNKKTGRKISACLPMHTFGFPVHLDELIKVCNDWNISIVEDAAEAIGSFYKGRHLGSFGKLGVFSFNGNKIITSGGGGAIVTNNIDLGLKAKHLTTTAKKPHPYKYLHDELGYNFRMPNINAALACAQLEQIDDFLISKRKLALHYKNFFEEKGIIFRTELEDTKVNYWLMCLELENQNDKDLFLKTSNNEGIMTRPIWELMYKLPMFKNFQRDEQINAKYLEERIVNIPSSVR